MQSFSHAEAEPEAARTRSSSGSRDDTAVMFRSAAAGRTDVLGTTGLMRLQRDVGNAATAQLIEESRSPVLDVVSSGGAALEPEIRGDMEARLGADFSDVRIHTDDAAHKSAEAVSAHAFTVGSDIAFQRDAYDPGSESGQRTLAHELTHVIQQRRGPVDGTPTGDGVSVSDPSDLFEREAAASAERAMSLSNLGSPSTNLAPGEGLDVVTENEALAVQPLLRRDADHELGDAGSPMSNKAWGTDSTWPSDPGANVEVVRGGFVRAPGDARLASWSNANPLLQREVQATIHLQRDASSQDYLDGYQDGQGGEEDHVVPRDGEAAADYEQGYRDGRTGVALNKPAEVDHSVETPSSRAAFDLGEDDAFAGRPDDPLDRGVEFVDATSYESGYTAGKSEVARGVTKSPDNSVFDGPAISGPIEQQDEGGEEAEHEFPDEEAEDKGEDAARFVELAGKIRIYRIFTHHGFGGADRPTREELEEYELLYRKMGRSNDPAPQEYDLGDGNETESEEEPEEVAD